MSTPDNLEHHIEEAFRQEELVQFSIPLDVLGNILCSIVDTPPPSETTVQYSTFERSGMKPVFDESELTTSLKPVVSIMSRLSSANKSVTFRASDRDAIHLPLSYLDHALSLTITQVTVIPEDLRAAGELNKARRIHGDAKTGRHDGYLRAIAMKGRVFLFDPQPFLHDDQIVSYHYDNGVHSLQSSAHTVSQAGDLYALITTYAGRLNGGHNNYFFVPQDAASLIELQLAFKGKPELRLADRVLRLMH